MPGCGRKVGFPERTGKLRSPAPARTSALMFRAERLIAREKETLRWIQITV